MNVRQFAVAAVLGLGVAAAQANTVTFSTFTIGTAQQVDLLATSSLANPIVSFEVLSATPTSFIDLPTFYSLSFTSLAANTYTVKLVTAGSSPISVGASGGVAGSLALTPVPEPESYAMALAGLSIAGLMMHRRRAPKA